MPHLNEIVAALIFIAVVIFSLRSLSNPAKKISRVLVFMLLSLTVLYSQAHRLDIFTDFFGKQHRLAKEEVDKIKDIRTDAESQLSLINLVAESADQAKKMASEAIDASSLANKQTAATNEQLKKASEELEFIKQRNDLIRLGDRCIAKGDRASYDRVLKIAEDPLYKGSELQNMATSEILRIKSFYLSGERYGSTPLIKTLSNGGTIKDDELSVEDLIHTLKNSKKDADRSVAAKLLGSKKRQDIPDILLEAFLNDQSLDVVRYALKSFSALTNYNPKDVFPFKDARVWWDENRTQTLTKLAPQIE